MSQARQNYESVRLPVSVSTAAATPATATAAAASAAATAAAVAAPSAATITASSSAAARLTGSGFVNDDLPTVELGLVHLGDRVCRLVVLDVYEAESSAFNDADLRCAVFRERGLESLLSCAVGKVSYE
jgi:hypothetical protein